MRESRVKSPAFLSTGRTLGYILSLIHISVSRVDDMAHCFIERGGVRLLDVELKMGGYDEPSYKMGQEGASRETVSYTHLCPLSQCATTLRGRARNG